MGSGITDLTPLARGGGAGRPVGESHQRSVTARGIVAKAPTSPTSSMWVIVPGLTPRYGAEVPARNWRPDTDGSLPAKDTTCLVVFDDQGDAWVPLWH